MGIIPRFGVFGDVGNGRECPVYGGFVGLGVVLVVFGLLWGVGGVGLFLGGGGGGGVGAGPGPCWASWCLSEPFVRRLGGVRGVLDHADKSDDCAQAAYIVAREKERLVYGVVFGDA